MPRILVVRRSAARAPASSTAPRIHALVVREGMDPCVFAVRKVRVHAPLVVCEGMGPCVLAVRKSTGSRFGRLGISGSAFVHSGVKIDLRWPKAEPGTRRWPKTEPGLYRRPKSEPGTPQMDETRTRDASMDKTRTRRVLSNGMRPRRRGAWNTATRGSVSSGVFSPRSR